MPLGIWNTQWPRVNAERNYPLADDATRTDLSGTVVLDNALLLELYLPVHAGLNVQPEKFFLRTLAVFGTGLTLGLAYDDDTASPAVVATVSVAFDTHTELDAYPLVGSGSFRDIQGKVVLGSLDGTRDLAAGQYYFAYTAGKLDVDTIRPILRGVSSITLINGEDVSEALDGDIELFAGTNIRLSLVEGGIQIDAIDGAGLNDICACAPDDGPPIRRINGIGATASGDFYLVGDECLDITAITNGLRLADTCSAPCCGCPELEAVTRDLERFGEAATTLTNFATRLDAEVTQMSTVVLGSKLNDRNCGCVES